eukprot:gene8754-9689_t
MKSEQKSEVDLVKKHKKKKKSKNEKFDEEISRTDSTTQSLDEVEKEGASGVKEYQELLGDKSELIAESNDANNQENLNGILNEMATAKLHKVKQVTEKRKHSNKETENKVDDDSTHLKKKKKFSNNQTSIKQYEAGGTAAISIDETNPNINYLLEWKNNRNRWSFKKSRQTWLLRNMYDQTKLSDKHFKILVKYMKGLQGKSKEETLSKAKEIVDKEQDESKTEEEGEVEKLKQNRALKIVRLLS